MHTNHGVPPLDAADAFLLQHDPSYRPVPDTTPNEIAHADIGLVSDARQSSGGDMLMSAVRPETHDNLELNGRDPDEAIDAKTVRLRKRIEHRQFLRDLLQVCNSDAERRGRVKRCIRQLGFTKAEDIRAAIIATLDDLLAGLRYTFKQRRDWIAARLGVSVATANARVKYGQQVLDLAVRMAAEKPNDVADPDPVATPPKRIKPDLRKATRNTAFDSDARRTAIAALSLEEQAVFVRLLERKSVEGDIEAIDKADRKSRIQMLPHAYNQVLDDVGRSDDQSRRLLARMSPEERSALCADWVGETIDAAIGGDADQRQAARSKFGSREYHKMVREFLARKKGAAA